MTTSADLLDLVVAALLGPAVGAQPPVFATAAGTNVYRPGDWPTQGGQYPILKLRVPRETKQSLGRGGPPQFTVTSTIRIVGEVSAPADINDAGASAAEAALWRLARQVEVAVIGSYPLEARLQQFASVDSQLSYSADAESHLAGIQIDLGLEFYQGIEDFAPIEADPIQEIDGTDTNHSPHGFAATNLQQ